MGIPILIAGGGLITLGLILIRHHGVVWIRQQSEPNLSEKDLEFFRRQHRRRIQTSGILTLIGLVMLVGDIVVANRKDLLTFVIWLTLLLLLVIWVLLLAMGDWWAIRAHTQSAIAEVQVQQLALERKAERLRKEFRGEENGHSDSTG
ncbi:hypothetical protein [Symmachiella dynata]|uniref:hypothetical protein n=1 Tax=Symmachiella dynata TaxID=2527995 RepID=UPI0030EE0079